MDEKRGALAALLLVVFIDILGFTLLIPILPFYAEHFGASETLVGALIGVYGLCSLVAAPILGRLSDVHGRKPVLIVSQMGTCLSFVVLALAQNLPMVFIARIIDGITAGNVTVAQAFAADLTEPRQRARIFGYFGAIFGTGFILGPALAGILSTWGPTAPIWGSAGLSLLSVICSTIFLKNRRPLHQGPKLTGADRWALLKNPSLRGSFVSFFGFCVSFALVTSGIALYSERQLHWHGHPFSQREVGWLMSYLGGIGLIVQAGLLGRLVARFREHRVLFAGCCSSILGLFTVAFSPNLVIFMVGMSFNQLGAGLIRSPLTSIISQRVPRDRQGLAFGMTTTLLSLAQVLCPPVTGLLIEHAQFTFWALLAAAAATTPLIFERSQHDTSDENRAATA